MIISGPVAKNGDIGSHRESSHFFQQQNLTKVAKLASLKSRKGVWTIGTSELVAISDFIKGEGPNLTYPFGIYNLYLNVTFY